MSIELHPQEPITACEDGSCITGGSNCKEDLCGFVDEDGVLHPNGIVVKETEGTIHKGRPH